MLKLYAEVWLPKVTSDGIVIDMAAAGGRPLSITLDEKKHARIHDRVMELLVDVQRRVFATTTPNKIVELFKLSEGNPPAFGIQDGFFRYYSGSTPILGGDGKYQVPLARVRFNTPVSEDEIDGPMQIRDNSGIPSTGPDCHSIWTCYP